MALWINIGLFLNFVNSFETSIDILMSKWMFKECQIFINNAKKCLGKSFISFQETEKFLLEDIYGKFKVLRCHFSFLHSGVKSINLTHLSNFERKMNSY